MSPNLAFPLRPIGAADLAVAANTGAAATLNFSTMTPTSGAIRYVRLVAYGADMRVSFQGTAATTQTMLMPAGSVEYFMVQGATSVSAISNTATAGTLNVTTMGL